MKRKKGQNTRRIYLKIGDEEGLLAKKENDINKQEVFLTDMIFPTLAET